MSLKSTIGRHFVIILLLELVLNYIVFFTTLNMSNLIYRSSSNEKMSKSNSKVTKNNLNSKNENLNSSDNQSVAITKDEKIKSTNQEYQSVHANKLTIEKEVEDKSVFDTVNLPFYQSDENRSNLNVLPREGLNAQNNQSDSCSVKLSTELELVKDVESLEKADTKSSSIKSEDKLTLMSSNSVVKLPKVLLKVIDENGRKRKFKIRLNQRMAWFVCL